MTTTAETFNFDYHAPNGDWYALSVKPDAIQLHNDAGESVSFAMLIESDRGTAEERRDIFRRAVREAIQTRAKVLAGIRLITGDFEGWN